jgi:hypothetical protein
VPIGLPEIASCASVVERRQRRTTTVIALPVGLALLRSVAILSRRPPGETLLIGTQTG